MSLRTPGMYAEIAVANMDLYPYSLPGLPSWGSNLEQLISFLEKTGCRNYEIHPTDTLVQDAQQRLKNGDTELIDMIVGSLHQTFNEHRDTIGRLADLRRVQRAGESIDGMYAIQQALSRPVPSVHYAQRYYIPIPTQPDSSGYPGSFPVVQPTAEAYRDFRIKDPKNLLGTMGKLGLIGLCPDTVHSRRKAADGTQSPFWRDVWANQFASGHTYQMHVSADRRDMATRDPELAALSHKEFQIFVSGDWKAAKQSELGRMIISAIENWVPPTALLQAVGSPLLRMVIEIPPMPKSILRRVSEHRRFVDTLSEIIRDTGATPLQWQDKIPE